MGLSSHVLNQDENKRYVTVLQVFFFCVKDFRERFDKGVIELVSINITLLETRHVCDVVKSGARELKEV